MKRKNKLSAILAGAIVLTGIGSADLAAAQTLNSVRQPLLSTTNKTEFKMNEVSPADPDWQAEFRAINLSPEQIDKIRNLKAILEQQAFEGFDIMGFIAMAQRPTGKSEFQNGPIAAASRNYHASISQVPTPQQYKQWRRNGNGER